MKIIVGLGNPGRAYCGNRHNVGFLVVDVLGARYGIEIKKRSFGAEIGMGSVGGCAVIIAKPMTYMNLSGDAVAPLARFYKVDIENLIVVHDDLDIELGRLKIAKDSGHGGHNGVRSICESFGTTDFMRIRVGIGRPAGSEDPANYVLENFNSAEMPAARKAVEKAADAIEVLLEKGMAFAQQKFH